MDLLNVCAGVTIKMLECCCSLELSYSGENSGVLEWFGIKKKLNLTGLCFTHPIVPCPFSGLFLICGLTAEAFFPLSYWKWGGPESSSFLSTCEFALLGGSQTIFYKCVTNFGLLFVTLLSIGTIKQFLSHKRTSKTDAVFLVPSSVSLIKGSIKAFCIAITQPNYGKDLILVLLKWSPSKVGKSRLAPSPIWTWGSSRRHFLLLDMLHVTYRSSCQAVSPCIFQ